jgi:predicted dinucleotide-utilizing enzyme
MIRTVDLVVAGGGSAARAAAVSALRRGLRVLLILQSADTRLARRLRRCILRSAGRDVGQLGVMTGADVVCADGIDGVEAVVVRRARTGCLCAVNTSGFVSFERRAFDDDDRPALEPTPW